MPVVLKMLQCCFTALGPSDCNFNGIPDDIDLTPPPSTAYFRFESPRSLLDDESSSELEVLSASLDFSEDTGPRQIPSTSELNRGSGQFAPNGFLIADDPSGATTSGGANFTIEAWVKLDQLSDTSGNNQRQFLVQKKELAASGPTQDYSILIQAANIRQSVTTNYGKDSGFSGREIALTFGNGTEVWSVISFLEINDLEWHHVSVAFDGDSGFTRFGMDGVYSVIGSSGIGHTTSSGPLLIGAHTNNAGSFNQHLRGSIDEFRFVPEYLPATELMDNFTFADCNQNGLLDSCEIADGQGDCDGDGELDECSLIDNDCDSNGVPDQCDPDCNSNGIADTCDIVEGTSEDCQPDGVPDECQLDVETNLFYDIGFGIIAWRADVPYMAWLNRFNVEENAGTLYGIEVQFGIMPAGTVVPVYVWSDPNGDGDPTDAQVLWSTEVIVEPMFERTFIPVPNIEVGSNGSSFFVGFMAEPTLEDFPASLDIIGEPIPDRSWGVGSTEPIDPNNLSNNAVEYGTVNNILFGNQWVIRAQLTGNGTDCNQNGSPDDCDILSGSSIDTDADGVPDECPNDCNDNGTLDGFDIADGLSQDCNGDAVPDECQLFSNDCDDNGVPDDCQIVGQDCNANGILDACDIASGYDTDADQSLVPDECEDCNGNGTLDSEDLSLGFSEDCNQDGTPDECQFGTPLAPRTYFYDDGVQEGNLCVIGGSSTYAAWMNPFQVTGNNGLITAIEVVWGYTYPDLPAEVVVWSDPDNDGTPFDAQVLTRVSIRTAKIDNPADNTNVIPIPPTYVGPEGTSFFVGVSYFDLYNSGCFLPLDYSEPSSQKGWFALSSTEIDLNDLSSATLYNTLPYDFLVRAVGSDGELAGDCNADGLLDECNIAQGSSVDFNGNGLPDECECLGDFTADGTIGFEDVLYLLSNWGSPNADLNGNGTTDFEDLLVILSVWGTC